MNKLVAGLDIGGTKCAVSLGMVGADHLDVVERVAFATPLSPNECVQMLQRQLDQLLAEQAMSLSAIGISCGGPLSSEKGIVMSPPNLPHWDNFQVVTPFSERYHVPVKLQNDANACALAEWRYGAGKGLENMIFLTCGTGLGAGLILNGQLYTGKEDMAGEVGHMRLSEYGPFGFGKYGSFEGFGSGAGFSRFARMKVTEAIHRGQAPTFCPDLSQVEDLSAKLIGDAAQNGDAFAMDLFEMMGENLGRGIALLIDILNPQAIVIGSVYVRQQALLEPAIMKVLRRECLPQALAGCRLLPAGLGESVGDYAALSIGSCLL